MSLFRDILSSRFSDPMFLLLWDRNQTQDWHWALFHFSYSILYLLLVPEQVLSKWSATTLEHQWLVMAYCLRPTSNWPQQLGRDSSPRVGIWDFCDPTNRFDIETIGLNEFWKFQLKKYSQCFPSSTWSEIIWISSADFSQIDKESKVGEAYWVFL